MLLWRTAWILLPTHRVSRYRTVSFFNVSLSSSLSLQSSLSTKLFLPHDNPVATNTFCPSSSRSLSTTSRRHGLLSRSRKIRHHLVYRADISKLVQHFLHRERPPNTHSLRHKWRDPLWKTYGHHGCVTHFLFGGRTIAELPSSLGIKVLVEQGNLLF